MPTTLQELGIDQWSIEARLALLQEIWDSLDLESDRFQLTDSQRREVDRRLDAHQANPQAAIPWERAEAEVLARLQP